MVGKRITILKALDWLGQPKGQFLLIAGITLLAALLRFYKLGEWSFWGDEIFTLGARADGFGDSLWRRSLARDLIHFTTATLGQTEWNARFIPALVGVITVPVLYFPVRRLMGSATALLASTLLAISTWHIYWSQNARFYTLLLLFYSLALLTFVIGLEEDRPAFLLLSLVFLGLAARERLLALMAVPVIFTYLVSLAILGWEKPRGLRTRNLVLLASSIAVLAALFAGRNLADLSGWMRGFGFLNATPARIVFGTVYYLGPPMVCVATAGALHGLIKRNRLILFFGISAVIPVVLIAIAALFQYSANRYAFVSLTSWVVLAGYAGARLVAETRARPLLLVGGFLSLLIVLPLIEDAIYFQIGNGNREDSRAAIAYVAAHKQHGDLVFATVPDLVTYYLGERATAFAETDLRTLATQEPPRRAWILLDKNAAAAYPDSYAWALAHAWPKANFDVPRFDGSLTMQVWLHDPAHAPP